MKFGSSDFSFDIDDRCVPTSVSAEGRTLVHLGIRCANELLTTWTDQEDGERFEYLPDIPLIDLAYWLVSSWQDLIYSMHVPTVLASQRVSLARRWAVANLLSGRRQEQAFDWASSHVLEFAATDYALPNIAFQRRDDFMEISWDQRPNAPDGSSVLFTASSGSTLLNIDSFVSLCRRLIEWVAEKTAEVSTDVRVAEIVDFCHRDRIELAHQTENQDLRVSTT